MSLRAPALSEDIQTPTVSDALKRSARQLVLLSVFIGVATFAALLLFARPYQSEAKLVLVEHSAIAGLAALMFGLAWIVMTTALGGIADKRPATAKKRAEPLLTSLEDEPLLREISEAEVTVQADAAEASISSSASDTTAEPVLEAIRTPNIFTEIDILATRLKARRPSGGGHRTLITSDAEPVIPFAEALELAKSLAGSGAQTILIDWSPSGDGFARTFGLDTGAGWNDLLRGGACFDDIIQRLPRTRAHAIAAGQPLRNGTRLDADLLNLALDALDEVYDHIVVTARHDEGRALFECIEGRFDAGITVMTSAKGSRAPDDASVFIGFEVTDIDVLLFVRSEPAASPMAQRIALATRPREPVAQRA